MNKAIMMGRLTRDPELRYTQNNTPVSSFGLAVNRRFRRDGDPEADFFNVSCFGRTAEFTSKWFTKGMQVLIVGRVELRNWEDRNGNKRASLELIADEAYFASDKASNPRNNEQPVPRPAAPAFDLPTGGNDFSELTDDDGDVPF